MFIYSKDPAVINGPNVVDVSYPGFFDTLDTLRRT